MKICQIPAETEGLNKRWFGGSTPSAIQEISTGGLFLGTASSMNSRKNYFSLRIIMLVTAVVCFVFFIRQIYCPP